MPLLCRHPEGEEDEEGEEDDEAPMARLLQRPIPSLQQVLLPQLPRPRHPEWQARQSRRQRHPRQVCPQSIPPPLPSPLPPSRPLYPPLTLILGSGDTEAAPLPRASPQPLRRASPQPLSLTLPRRRACQCGRRRQRRVLVGMRCRGYSRRRQRHLPPSRLLPIGVFSRMTPRHLSPSHPPPLPPPPLPPPPRSLEPPSHHPFSHLKGRHFGPWTMSLIRGCGGAEVTLLT